MQTEGCKALLSAYLEACCVRSLVAMLPGTLNLSAHGLLTGMQASVEHAKQMRYCERGDCIVALHRIGNASVIKIVDIK